MDENAPARAADEADRSPFRRFPWVQLAFCVACLAMATWTWMRYSYCHELNAVLPAVRGPVGGQGHDACVIAAGHFVRTEGFAGPRETWQTSRPGHPDEHPMLVHIYIQVIGVHVDPNTYVRYPPESAPVWKGSGNVQREFKGRIVHDLDMMDLEGKCPCVVDTTVSRFHPASIAGLVVGAMGTFVFGLYLRRWLRERKAILTTEDTELTENDA